jgi:hypothetical protein
MLGLPLAFTVPLALAALAGLPLLYWLLRLTPPRPQQVPFPPLKLILDLQPKDETPAHTPLWVLIMRLVLAAAVIFAMAGPIWHPRPAAGDGAGPLVVVFDEGWPAAPTWERRVSTAAQRIEGAGAQGRPVALVATEDGAHEIVLGDATRALDRLRALRPLPYVADRMSLVAPLRTFLAGHSGVDVVWLADGVERGNARAFLDAVAQIAPTAKLLTDDRPIVALAGAQNRSDGMEVRVLRTGNGDDAFATGRVRAFDLKGQLIGEAPFAFDASATETKARFDLPVELRNDMARLEIADAHSAGAVALLDGRAQRRRVGLVSGETADLAQPLLAPTYYLAKALGPFADVREARPGAGDPIVSLLDEHVSVLVLADVGTVSAATHDRLAHFVTEGGTLLRFAGTRLAGASDDLVPVQLRRGGRVLGGSLSWDTPKRLAPFDPHSPFAGLTVPAEVTVSRQVLADPEPGLADKTWAQLSDGTPLVTAAQRGKGTIVLFHMTADTTWSNLPLSGLFVDMLRKIVTRASDTPTSSDGSDNAPTGAASPVAETAAPTRTLDGFGVLGAPPPSARPIAASRDTVGDAEHPPGFYGATEALIAVNVLGPTESLAALSRDGAALAAETLRADEPFDLRPGLVVLAFLLFLGDMIASLWLNGSLRRLRPVATAALLVLAATMVLSTPGFVGRTFAATAPSTQKEAAAAETTRLAYVVSGDAAVDETSRAGLATLSRALAARTSLSPGTPDPVDPARDELAFYPLLYWPVVAGRPQPSAGAIARAAAFMRQGGTIVFDTRDALSSRPGGPPTPESAWLRQLLDGVDVPELEPVPPDHVVTKTFYLLNAFVGRYTDAATWIEALPAAAPGETAPVRSGDGVSPIVVTGNDLAAGWAGDANGDSLYALVPGGARQHELALRGGVNLVMYTLTGNYKADQVHVRDLLQRLGH